MRFHTTSNQELKKIIYEGLRKNSCFCPCVPDSKDKEQYKCPCENFRLNVKIGETCHCGLYIKDED